MKLRTLILLAVTAGSALAAEPESFTVNGLTVIFKQNTANDIVSASMFFRGGAAVLSTRQAGIENLALDVATKASARYPKDLLNATLEKMDSRLSSSAGIDFSSVDLLCVKQNFAASWDLFADVLLHPSMTAEDVDLERGKILASIKQMKDNPDAYLNDLARRAFYTDHPYETSVTGTVETVSAFTPAELKEYLATRMTASQVLLVVVGNTTRAELESMVKASFGSLPAGTYSASLPPPVEHREPSIKVVQRTLPTNYIMGYYPAPAFGTKDYYAMLIAGSVLRDRLFEEVRTKRGLSYAPGAGTAGNFSNYGYLYVTAVQPDTTIAVMMAELRKLIDEPVSASDMRNKINVFLTTYYMRNETNRSQAQLLATYELSGAGYKEADNFIAHAKAVTPEEVQSVCKTYIKNLQFVVIGNYDAMHLERFAF